MGTDWDAGRVSAAEHPGVTACVRELSALGESEKQEPFLRPDTVPRDRRAFGISTTIDDREAKDEGAG